MVFPHRVHYPAASMSKLGAALAVALIASWASLADAADQLLPGRKLVLRALGSRQKLGWLSRSPAVVAPTPDGADDPTHTGGRFEIRNPATGESAVFDLPASQWTRNAAGSSYRFVNRSAPAGPSEVSVAAVRGGRMVKVRARAIGITLDEASQGGLGVILVLGSARYCALFGGEVRRDEPGAFTARNAPPPASCPDAAPTTTTTSSTTTTTIAGPPILAGAARVNTTPFTLTPALLACRDDPGCPYQPILALSNPDASNPDGLPGGLFQTIGEEMAPGQASTDWVGPVGVWGEPFGDANQNGRFDAGESFTDDPANASTAVGAGHPSTLGDPASSTNKWDGVYIAGYGNDRVARGAFDPIGARVLFLRDTRTGTSIAWVAIDAIGYFSDFVGRIRARLPADLDVDQIILTSTHLHEGPDIHLGLWGQDTTVDGTYPRFEIYLEAKIAQAIAAAAQDLRPARFRFGAIRPGEGFVTPRGNLEDLTGMMSRNSCRTPWFFDDELRVMQVVADPDTAGGATIGTLLNWGAHVESMDSRNEYVSADFPQAARTLVEEELGGVALYVPAAQGASEIIGDSCARRWQRDTFDGETYPVDAGGEPLAFQDPYDNRVPRDRTYAIGRVVGAAAVAALAGEPLDPPDAPFELIGPRLLCFPVNNEGLVALAAAGVIDKPLVNSECPTAAGSPPERAKSALYALRLGSASFVTAPGEVAPELYYGIAAVNRAAATGDYVTPNPDALACSARSHHGTEQPGAHSDRPYEPAIRPAQEARFGARVNFLVGYTPDLLGYVVPGYDFFWLGGPGGFGVPVEQIADPCSALPPDLAFPQAIYGSHYQETNSAGSMLAPAIACELARLLSDPLGEAVADPLAEGPRRACFEWDVANATGRPVDQPPPAGYEPGCPVPDPEACSIRHY